MNHDHDHDAMSPAGGEPTHYRISSSVILQLSPPRPDHTQQHLYFNRQ
jgi:hypothetical protein